MLLLLRSSRTRFGKLSNTSESTDCIPFPLRYKSVNCSRGLGKESALILEMLFPVTNRILVLLGIDCGIESKSCFWHFTVCEEHTHRSGQLRQGSETASTTSRWTIADPSPLGRISPHVELNRRISVTVRKDSLDENSILPVPPSSSARHTPKFFQLFCFLKKKKTRLYLLTYNSNSTELLFKPSSLRTSAQLHEKILWTKPANLCLLFVVFVISFLPKAHGSMQTHAMFYDSGKTFMSEVKRGKAQKSPRGDSPKEAMKCNRTSRV